ncbi:PSD1 and planctomycete cytochrome C domain-containing protein [Stieleria mannarensis]|uniref:PSD1 and planctomycete cytochrome C domain-containing protein n=1 Tax=Stieleria mannarensis TaxID=2755585 RepID=UPI0016012190|nr:PSD1 and planctomycete cytochrome C domain-containing protein [Rhodopirellula sp. JC639]
MSAFWKDILLQSRSRALALSVCLCLSLQVTSANVAAIDFQRDIEPIFQNHCIDCHGPEEQANQFRLDRLANLLSGGNSGEPAVVPGDPDASYLLRLIKHEEPDREMPPDGKLSSDEIELIRGWIADGARTPASYGPAKETIQLDHWSFRPLHRPRVPAGNSAAIDWLIHRKLDQNGLQPSPAADRRTLIRRLSLVMTGLPPTPEDVTTFLRDDRPDAWQRLVDRTLSSEHYGQRWASHWLDLVRFGETNGFETNRERPDAWPYRDWVIDSLNEDKPYDQFVRRQIAGDALGDDVGTGFLVAGPHDIVKGKDPKLGLVQRMNELDDMINTTGTAFLGLTTGCARCHNHKFDPISQRDYYAMQAVFAGVHHGSRSLTPSRETKQQLAKLDAEIADLTEKLKRFLADESTSNSMPRPAVNAVSNEERFEPRLASVVRFTIKKTSGGQACIDELEIYSGDRNVALASSGAKATSSGDFKHPLHKLRHINDGQYGNARSWIVDSVSGGWVQIEFAKPTVIDRIVWGRDRQKKYSDRLATVYHIEAADGENNWVPLASSDDRRPFKGVRSNTPTYQFESHPEADAAQGRAWLNRLRQARSGKSSLETSAQVYAGTFSQPGKTYRLYRGEPDAPREPVGPDTIDVFGSLNLNEDAPEQSRRLALADWITDATNPLTPRVIVNRIWQFHFGTGIVDTPSDFGHNGARPSHPELLDWLASELIQHDWSLKHIHRLILNSHTWRQSNRPVAAAMTVDADCRLLWRFPPRRCDAETIRDSILTVSDSLRHDAAGGPGFSAFAVQLENVRHYHPKQDYGPDDWRRMIYMTKVRQEKDQVFGVFDCPDASMVVPRRSRSTTPLQALNLLNSRFVMQQAGRFAKRLERESDSTSRRVTLAWQWCFGRPPSEEELSDSAAFIGQQGLTQFTRALLNSNEFVLIP